MKNIRPHLRSISIVLSLAQLYFIFKTVSLLILAISGLYSGDNVLIDILKSDFFSKSNDTPSVWMAAVFLLLIIVLNIFLIFRLRLASRIVRRYQVGKLLTLGQSKDLEKVGKGFDYYSFLWYATHLIFGAFFFSDLTSFYKTLPYALVFFLLGKVILILSTISAKAEVLKEENDLTV
ncbi:hypothetical protein [Leeuwenhoekiella sp. H156]|uniref:hypothetical protein n=1 Tax=Leeuwenhoekiella sp. H156 TaxID=3450128 RepID=UPI003FA441C3